MRSPIKWYYINQPKCLKVYNFNVGSFGDNIANFDIPSILYAEGVNLIKSMGRDSARKVGSYLVLFNH